MASTVSSPAAPAGDRRRSGRATRAPAIFSQEDHTGPLVASGKRKRESVAARTEDDNDGNDVNGAETSEESGDDSSNDEPEDSVKRPKRGAKRSKPALAKPATKRTKTTNGVNTTLAIRSAKASGKNVSGAVKKKARSRPSQMSSTSLYAEVFGHGKGADEVAAKWHDEMERDNAAGIRDLVNFILECIGCDSRIDSSDVEDFDNVPNRLGDVLNEYANQKQADYPLSSKSKHFHGMREVLMEFSRAIINALHNSGVLYDQPEIYDNVHVWTATMSGAGYRSFRHTATIISLSMSTALCDIAKELQGSMAATKTQLDTEKKKKSSNKSRIAKLQEETKTDAKRLEFIDAQLSDAFDTVYSHRYRDVDEKIRVECVVALGGWILAYRKMFMDAHYLRYLGWVIADPNATTRLEVIRQLKALFQHKQNVAVLRGFTERFRARLVEMGARDADTNVRAETIELLDRLRNAELLEPDDIDIVGHLIFDEEPRIRKAVAKFFVSNIQDLYKASIEDFDDEQFAEILPRQKEIEDFKEPCQAWIKFKCLAQTLAIGEENENNERRRSPGIYGTEEIDSRYMLATQSIYPYMPELKTWESIAGYLLYDHSSIPIAGEDTDISTGIQAAYKLESGEELILLDVLFYSVKLSLQEILDSKHDQKSKQSTKAKTESRKKQESAAHHLTVVIPDLLSKYGSAPGATASILRLEQLLNADMINDLEAGEATYDSILDDINKAFLNHSDRKVLAEATRALRAARSYENSKDAANAKVAEMWAEAGQNIVPLISGKNISARGTLDRTTLGRLVENMGRISQLASVSDCCDVLENRMNWPNTKANKGRKDSLFDILMQLAKRGIPDDDTPKQFIELEDRLCGYVIAILSLYFRWKVVGLKAAISTKDARRLSVAYLTNLSLKKSDFVETISPIITSRSAADQIRIDAILTMLDLFTLFATIQHMKPEKGSLDENTRANLKGLATELDRASMTSILESHEKMEKRLAQKTRKKIELPIAKAAKQQNQKRKSQDGNEDVEDGDDEAADNQGQNQDDIEKPPEDSDDEAENQAQDSDSSLDEDDGQGGRGAKKQATLLAEQALCELTSKIVLGVIAGILPSIDTIKHRLQVNRSRLGKSYGQVIAYLDEKKDKSKSQRKDLGAASGTLGQSGGSGQASTKKGGLSAAKTGLGEAMELVDDEIEDDEVEAAEQPDGDDPEALRQRGLADDEDDEDGDRMDEDNEGGDEDGVIGD